VQLSTVVPTPNTNNVSINDANMHNIILLSVSTAAVMGDKVDAAVMDVDM
jgi:hypothetical protein